MDLDSSSRREPPRAGASSRAEVGFRFRHHILRFGFLGLVLVLIGILPRAAKADGSVTRNGKKLSLNFHDVALKIVLMQLQRDAHITVKVPSSLPDRKVTVNFRDLAIDPALETLFKSAAVKNFAIVHQPGASDRVTVMLLEDANGGSTPPRLDPEEEMAVAHDGAPTTPEMRPMFSPPSVYAPGPDGTVSTAPYVPVPPPDEANAPEWIPPREEDMRPAPPPGSDLPKEPRSGIAGREGNPITSAQRPMFSPPGPRSR